MASTIYRLYSYSWDNVPTGEAPTGKDLTSGKLSGSDTYRTCFVVLQAVCQSIFPWCLGANVCCWWTSKMLAEYAVHWADERKGIGLIVYEVMAQNLSIPQKNKIRMLCSFLFPWFSMVSTKNMSVLWTRLHPVSWHFLSISPWSHPGDALGSERWPVDDCKRRWQDARGACQMLVVLMCFCIIGKDDWDFWLNTFFFPLFLATGCLCFSVSRFQRIGCFHGTKARRLIPLTNF